MKPEEVINVMKNKLLEIYKWTKVIVFFLIYFLGFHLLHDKNAVSGKEWAFILCMVFYSIYWIIKRFIRLANYMANNPPLMRRESGNRTSNPSVIAKPSISNVTKKKDGIEDKIETLNNLLKKGLITQLEYSKKKKELLDKF